MAAVIRVYPNLPVLELREKINAEYPFGEGPGHYARRAWKMEVNRQLYDLERERTNSRKEPVDGNA